MAGFLHCCHKYVPKAFLSLTVFVMLACGRNDSSEAVPDGAVAVPLEIVAPVTKAFANDLTHHVNRVLILPFRKTDESLGDDNANYVPVYTYARQVDVNQFPLSSVTLHLPVQSTYKILAIGYNRTDYDFSNRSNPANRFDIGSTVQPTTLANFQLSPRSAVSVPEFFTTLCEAFGGGVSKGAAFRPEQGYTVQGTLQRLVSGFSIAITGVPGFVKSITLRAENLVKSSLAVDASVTAWQTAGDGGARILGKKSPSAGSVSFDLYLLPTFTTYKTGFFLDVEFGSATQSYTVKAADGAAVSGNRFIFNPNQAVNLTGSYSLINLGFSISYGINLDDNSWDGIQNTQ